MSPSLKAKREYFYAIILLSSEVMGAEKFANLTFKFLFNGILKAKEKIMLIFQFGFISGSAKKMLF